MRVIAFTTELDVSRGGKQRSMLDICQGLAKRGHKIDLLYLKDGDLYQIYAQFCHQCLQVNTYDVAKHKLIRSIFDFGQNLRTISKQLCHADSDSNRTVIYIDDHILSLFAYGLSCLHRWPVVFHIRQPVLDPLPQKYSWPIRNIQRFVTVSRQVKQDWSQIGIAPKDIYVIHNGIDTDYFKPGDRDSLRKQIGWSLNERIVIYLGRIDPSKGLETFIRAISLLLNQQPALPLKVLIVGRPVLHSSGVAGEAYVKSLHGLADSLNLKNVLEFRPFVEQPLSLYQLSDLTVLPSIYPEPFGRILIESMACGTPALGSRIGGIPEILTGELETGLFESGNPEALAQKIQAWLHWRDRDPTLGDRCRHHVSQSFSLSQTIDQVEAILLGESRA